MKTESQILILGAGVTAQSCLRFYQACSGICHVHSPDFVPALHEIKKNFPESTQSTGVLAAEQITSAKQIIVSPGIDLTTAAFQNLDPNSDKICSDLDIFATTVSTDYVAITGSNGKTTVTHLCHEMAQQARIDSAMCGNVGPAVLDVLAEQHDFYVLECSSFQLALSKQLSPQVACLLNITADHIDRHGTFAHYKQSKLTIFNKADIWVYPRMLQSEIAELPTEKTQIADKLSFGLSSPKNASEIGIHQGWICLGDKPFMSVAELSMPHEQYYLNAMAAFAIGHSVGLPWEAMRVVLSRFKGLPHRLQFVQEKKGVNWWNDSKATNIGATLAALNSLSRNTDGIVLILGGDSKGADFRPLAQALSDSPVQQVVILGKDKALISQAVKDADIPCYLVDTMDEAVKQSALLAQAGMAVLLSPACSSLDSYRNFAERGEMFMNAVLQWA